MPLLFPDELAKWTWNAKKQATQKLRKEPREAENLRLMKEDMFEGWSKRWHGKNASGSSKRKRAGNKKKK